MSVVHADNDLLLYEPSRITFTPSTQTRPEQRATVCNMTSAPPITIIGAGLSGPTPGLCLKHRRTAAVVYDRATSSPRYNHGMVLHSSTYRPLLSILHMDETTFREKSAVNAQQGGSGSLPGDARFCTHRRLSLSPWPA